MGSRGNGGDTCEFVLGILLRLLDGWLQKPSLDLSGSAHSEFSEEDQCSS